MNTVGGTLNLWSHHKNPNESPLAVRGRNSVGSSHLTSGCAPAEQENTDLMKNLGAHVHHTIISHSRSWKEPECPLTGAASVCTMEYDWTVNSTGRLKICVHYNKSGKDKFHTLFSSPHLHSHLLSSLLPFHFLPSISLLSFPFLHFYPPLSSTFSPLSQQKTSKISPWETMDKNYIRACQIWEIYQ